MRIILIGDLHYDLKQPLKRIDDIKETFSEKFNWLRKHSRIGHKILYVCTGDIFNKPNPDVTVINHLIDEISTLPGDFVTTSGNHDLFNYDITSHNKSALSLMEKALDNFYVVNTSIKDNLDFYNEDEYYKDKIMIVGRYFTNDIDNVDNRDFVYNADKFTYDIAKNNNRYLLGIVHGMVLEKPNKFIKHTLAKDLINTNFDFLLTGHDHTGYKFNGKCYNPGSLYRSKIDEKDRDVKVGVLDIEFNDDTNSFTQTFSESFFDSKGEFYEYKPIEILQDTKELIKDKNINSSNINLYAYVSNLEYTTEVKRKALGYLMGMIENV